MWIRRNKQPGWDRNNGHKQRAARMLLAAFFMALAAVLAGCLSVYKTLSIDSSWQVNLTPDDEYSVLILENPIVGRHRLTVSVKDSSGKGSSARTSYSSGRTTATGLAWDGLA